MTAKEKICNDFVKEYSAFLAQFGMHIEINNKLIGATTGLFAKYVTPLLDASQSKWVSVEEFIKAVKEEFSDMNLDYLNFINDRINNPTHA